MGLYFNIRRLFLLHSFIEEIYMTAFMCLIECQAYCINISMKKNHYCYCKT